jgi:hypothetical protein
MLFKGIAGSMLPCLSYVARWLVKEINPFIPELQERSHKKPIQFV